MKFSIRASFWFATISILFVWTILNFDITIEPNWPWKSLDLKSISIPELNVRLRNNGNKKIALPVKGELYLWPPGDQDWDLEGGYIFKYLNGNEIYTRVVYIPSMEQIELIVQLTKTTPIHQDMDVLKRLFRDGDWHIQLIFATEPNRRILGYSHHIPFTNKGMSKTYTFNLF